jgi:hypothetical protein
LRLRARADGVDHRAAREADDASDQRRGHHHEQAERTAERAQHAGGRVAHRGAGARATHRADDLAAVPACRFFNRSVAFSRRSGAAEQEAKQEGKMKFHGSIDNEAALRSLT